MSINLYLRIFIIMSNAYKPAPISPSVTKPIFPSVSSMHKTSTVFSYLLIKGWQREKQIWSFLPEKQKKKPKNPVKLFWLFSTYLTTLNMRQKSYFKTHEFWMISYFKKIGRATLLAKFDAMPLTLFFKQRKQNSSFCLPKVSNSKLRRRRYSTRLGRGWFLFED